MEFYALRDVTRPENRARVFLAYLEHVSAQLRMLAPMAGGDVETALILFACLVGGVAHVEDDPALAALFSGLATPVPDAMRRPLPVMAVARSTGLKRETVRRKALALAARGLVRRTPEGLVAVTDGAPHYRATTIAGNGLFRQFLMHLGYGGEADPARRRAGLIGPAWEAAPLRAARIHHGFLFRAAVHLLALGEGSVNRGLVLTAMLTLVLRPDDPLHRLGADPGRVAGRAVERPMLAARQPLTRETLRRTLVELEGRGQMVRHGRAHGLDGRFLGGELLAGIVEQAMTDVRHAVRQLERAGLLSEPSPDARRPAARHRR